MRIKICGLRSATDARLVAREGVEFAGLNFVESSRRSISLSQAEVLIPWLGSVIPVGVFQDQDLAQVLSAAQRLGLRWIQLHGAESPAYCEALLGQGYRVVKASPDPQFEVTARLLDGPEPGSGAVWRWVRPTASGEFWLAGGLCAQNVGEAIARTRPDLVDVASGVEHEGVINELRVRQFVRAVRGE